MTDLRHAAASGLGEPAFLGIDLGTSGLKVVAIDLAGSTLGEAEARYPVRTPGADRAESDPQDWIDAMFAALRELAAVTGGLPGLAGAALAGQMHGTVLLDSKNEPLVPAVLWPDRRGESELYRWQALSPGTRGRLGSPLAAGMTGPTVAWFAQHDPETLDRTETVVLPKDVVRQALLDPSSGLGPVAAGRIPTDRSDASATLLWDVVDDGWSSETATAAGIPERLLPPVSVSTDRAGVSTALQDIFGAAHPVPVAIGAADTAAALLPLPRGAFGINLGTGCQLIAETPTAAATPDPSTHLYADAGHGWYVMAAIQNAGLALEWAAGSLGLDWPQFVAAAESAPPGSRGVTFLPFLTGERGRIAPAGAGAGWTGVTLAAGTPELARSAFEGVVCVIARAVDLIREQSGIRAEPGRPILISGGGGRNLLLLRLIADALDHPVQRVGLRSATATGAAMIAARSVGLDPQIQLDLGEVVTPGTGFAAVRAQWATAADS